jgi:hypothetical protein
LTTLCTLDRFGNTASRWPFRLAGLSPVRSFLAAAQSRIRLIRFNTRIAVSVFSCHNGSTIVSTSRVSMALIGRSAR